VRNLAKTLVSLDDPVKTFENLCKLAGGTYEEERGWFKEKKSSCEVEDDEDFVALSVMLRDMLPKLPKDRTFEVRYKYLYDGRGEFSVFNENSKLKMEGEHEGESSLTDEMMWGSVYDEINEMREKKGLRELEEDEIYEKVGHILEKGVQRGFEAVRGTPEKIKEEIEKQKEIGVIKPYLIMGDNLECDVEEYDGTTYPKCRIGPVDITTSPVSIVFSDMEAALDEAVERCSDNFYAELNSAIKEAAEKLPA